MYPKKVLILQILEILRKHSGDRNPQAGTMYMSLQRRSFISFSPLKYWMKQLNDESRLSSTT